jgi:GAF domain-containing protein
MAGQADQSQQLEGILELSRELVSTVSLPPLLRRIVEAAAQLTDSSSVAILLFEEQDDHLHFVAASDIADQLEAIPVPIDCSIAGAAFSAGEAVLVTDAQVDPRYYRKIEEVTGKETHSLLAVPLQYRDQRIGVLEARNKHGGAMFDQRDIDLLTALAAQATVAIENARLVQALEQTRSELEEQVVERGRLLEVEREQGRLTEGLRRASAALTSTLDYDQVLDRILQQIHQVMPDVAANIMLIEDTEGQRNEVTVLRGHGYEQFGSEVPFDSIRFAMEDVPLLAKMHDDGQVLVVADVTECEDWVYSRPEHTWIMSYAGVPIVIRDRVIGFLNVNSATLNFFSPSDAEPLLAFADHVAIAIENAELYEQAQQEIAVRRRAEEELKAHHERLAEMIEDATSELVRANEQLQREILDRRQAEYILQRRNRELAALNTATRTLSSSLELQDILDRSLSQTAQSLGFKAGMVTLVDERSGELRLYAQYSLPQPLLDMIQTQGLEGTPCDLVFRRRRPFGVGDMREGQPVDVQMLLDIDIVAYAGAPIIHRDRALGTFCLMDDRAHSVSEDDLSLLAAIGQQMGGAAEKVRLFNDVIRERQVSNTLLKTAKAVATTLRFDQLLELILEELQQVVHYDAASISMVHDERCWLAASRGVDHDALKPLRLRDHPLLRRIVNEQDVVVLPAVGEEPGWTAPFGTVPADGDEPGDHSWLGVPLIAKDTVVGIMTLDSYRLVYAEEDSDLAFAFAHQVALAIENSRLYEQMQAKLRERTLLHSVTAAISSTLDIDQILSYVVRSLCEILNGTSAEIYSLSQDDEPAVAVAHYASVDATEAEKEDRVGEETVLPKYSAVSNALAKRRPVQTVYDAPIIDKHLRRGLKARDAQATLVLPMLVGDRVLGFGQVWESQYGRHFTDSEIATGQTLIHQAAIAIYNAQLVDELRRHNAELELQNAELDAFAHTVAHDLKSPLTTLIGFGSLMEKRLDRMSEDTARANMRMMVESGQKMSNIIDELLILASIRKIDEVELEPLDMTGILAEVQSRLENLIAENQAQVVLQEDWPVALGRDSWVEEVWANYISNAIKYGGRPPHVELGATEQNGSVRFWVRDNGLGLDPQEQEKLFTPFTRLHKIHAEGHGLGLSIVQRIVEKLGGEVGVESTGKAGEGSLFFFTLPLSGR